MELVIKTVYDMINEEVRGVKTQLNVALEENEKKDEIIEKLNNIIKDLQAELDFNDSFEKVRNIAMSIIKTPIIKLNWDDANKVLTEPNNRESITPLSEEGNELKIENEKLQNENKNLYTQLNSTLNNKDDYVKINLSLLNENKKLEDRIKDLEGQVEDLDTQLDMKNEEIEDLEKKECSDQTVINYLKYRLRLSRSEQERMALVHDIEKKEEIIKGLNNEIDKLSFKLDEWKLNYHGLDAEYRACLENVSELQDKIDILSDENKKLKIERQMKDIAVMSKDLFSVPTYKGETIVFIDEFIPPKF